MELDRDRVADIAQRHGVDEREALILYHLGHAFELYFEIAKEEDYGYDVNLQDWVDRVLYKRTKTLVIYRSA